MRSFRLATCVALVSDSRLTIRLPRRRSHSGGRGGRRGLGGRGGLDRSSVGFGGGLTGRGPVVIVGRVDHAVARVSSIATWTLPLQ